VRSSSGPPPWVCSFGPLGPLGPRDPLSPLGPLAPHSAGAPPGRQQSVAPCARLPAAPYGGPRPSSPHAPSRRSSEPPAGRAQPHAPSRRSSEPPVGRARLLTHGRVMKLPRGPTQLACPWAASRVGPWCRTHPASELLGASGRARAAPSPSRCRSPLRRPVALTPRRRGPLRRRSWPSPPRRRSPLGGARGPHRRGVAAL
jgi:hypothetical protein